MSFVLTYRKAAREHDCNMCGRVIEKKESYARVFAKEKGKTWTNKECSHCRSVCDAFCDSNGVTSDSLTYDEAVAWLESESRLLIHVFNNKWRIGDSLLPVPFQDPASFWG